MFHSIRTKLVASYALIILLCLLLAGLGALVLVRRYQRDMALSQHRAVAATLSKGVQSLFASKLSLPEIAQRLRQEAQALGARALLVTRDGLILVDTGTKNPLTGRQLKFPIQELLGSRATAVVRRYLEADQQRYFLIILLLRLPPPPESSAVQLLPSYLIIAVPEQDIEPAWRQLAPPLAIAGLISLLISLVIAILLSRSITRPLIAMTKASEEMARGDYKQSIPVHGQDEVARLADSFNRMAREVERSRQSQRDFIANISHDLKTPLTSIQGFSQAILEGAVHDEEGYRRAAKIISEEATRMGQLIHDVLDLARLEAGEALKERTLIDFSLLVQHCVEKFKPLATEAGIELHFAVASNRALNSYGDERHLEQAISNLLDNAIKYTPSGGHVEIAIQALRLKRGKVESHSKVPCALPVKEKLSDGDWVAITVKDTGPGIPQEDLPRIFERFYRADKSRSGTEVSGLGLAIAKEIVEAHGGIIGVSNRPNGGACFSILLPMKQAPNTSQGAGKSGL